MPIEPITLEVDAHGSLVPHDPDEWLVCFVPPIRSQWWHWMLGSWMKHCFAMRRTSAGWLLFEPWWSRIMLCLLTQREADKFLAWGRRGIILAVKEHIPGKSSQLRVWVSCAALVAHLLGRRYWVWTPYQLHARLAAEPDTFIVSSRERGAADAD